MAKKSRWGRMVKLGGLTSRVSSSYLGQRISGVFQGEKDRESSLNNLHLKNAERIVDTMGALKGAAMKVGQSLAVLADSMDLPDEISQVLGKLHNKAEPIPYSEIEPVIMSQIDGPVESVFSRIDPEPLGTASLAQAHAAWLPDGQPVVIKVLHEGVEFSVDTDLAALKSILLAGRFIKRSRAEIDLLFAEIRERLLEELDYENEAINLFQFHKAFAEIDGLAAPKPVSELCTKRILVMERLVGMNLDDFVQNSTPEARQRAGDTLTRAFHEMLYVFRALHADPHGGNFLFKPDGSVGFIDFGCVKRFDSYFVADYSRLGNYLVDGDRPKMLEFSKKLEILTSDNPQAEQALWEFGEILAQPFRIGESYLGTTADRLMDDIRDSAKDILRFPEIRSSRDIIFLHRALTGTYSMLRRLNHRCNYETIRRQYAQHAIDVAEGRVLDRGWYER